MLLLAPLLVLVLGAPSALASRPHEFTGAFGTKCIAEPCTGEDLKHPSGVAVNEATGDVYVLDEGTKGLAGGRVAVFDQEGLFLFEFDGSGEQLNSKGEHFEGVAAGHGGKTGEIETGRFKEPQELAVDNSCALQKLPEPECREEHPSNGDVYVVDSGHRVIDRYTASGAYVGQITEAEGVPFANHPVEGLAVSSAGTVYVSSEEPASFEAFTPADPNAFAPPKIVTKFGALNGFVRPGLAIASQGDLYSLVKYEVQNVERRRVMKLAPSGEVLIEEVDGEPSSGVAVQQGNGNVVIDNLTTVAVLNSADALLERLGDEHGEHHLEQGAGVAVDASTGTIFVADAVAGRVIVFGPAKPGPPKIEGESVTDVTATGATLAAQVNANDDSGELTYRFQYGRCATASSCPSAGFEEAPGASGASAASFESSAVGGSLEALQPSTTYHFRVLVENALDTGSPVLGEESTFTTEGTGAGSVLPDGRGYELVSPPDKHGALIAPIAETGVVEAAASGDAVTYVASNPTEAAPKGYSNEVQVLSRRGAGAWSSADIAIPHSSAPGFAVGPGAEYKFFDPELSLSVVQPFGEFIPQLSEEASESTAYLHSLGESCAAHCFTPLVTGKPGVANVPEGTRFGEEESCEPRSGPGYQIVCGPEFLGADEDLSHVVLRSQVPLAKGAAPGALYEWSAGELAPVSVLPAPSGEQVAGTLGYESASTSGAISATGTEVLWSAGGDLYLRAMTLSETIELDDAEQVGGAPCAECTSGGARFQLASSDGSRVFFTDTNRLTRDSGAVAGKQADLYECRIVLTPKAGCTLTDLTPVLGVEHANVQGAVLGASADGSKIYFVARGAESGRNRAGQSPAAGQPNLYVHRDGSGTEFIATLSGEDESDWDQREKGALSPGSQPTRVSPSGRWLALMSQAQLTSFDNHDAATGQPVAEVYLYDATDTELRCASCNPTGARPVGIEYRKLEPNGLEGNGLVGGPGEIWPAKALVAANVPGWTSMKVGKSRYQPRYLSDSGRLFFDSAGPLVPQDVNGTEDVYEYEPPGVGDCTEASESYSGRSGGCVSLISAGTSSGESAFLDASESGDDVFFLTQSQLTPTDTDQARDVYDAHVCSTSSPCISSPAQPPAPCTSEALCKSAVAPQPQVFGAPQSQTFTGPENPAPASPATAKPKFGTLTRQQQLAKALRACRKKHKRHKRLACEKQARKRVRHEGAKKARSGKRSR